MSHTYRKSSSSFSGAPAKAARQQGRRSTPDSEALASSEDEGQDNALSRVKSNPVTTRRQSSSWLNDIQPHRKVSLGGGSQTGGSQPGTPLADPTGSRNSSGSAFPWGVALTSPTLSEQSDHTIGFLLNQKPVRKAVRSLSYSVGQQDEEPTSPGSSMSFAGRRGKQSSLKHQPSKPSLLGEAPLDTSGLGQVPEDEDDQVSCSNGSDGGGLKLPTKFWTNQDASTEVSSTTLLKQAAEQNARARHRASTTDSPSAYGHRKPGGPTRGLPSHEFDTAIEEIDDYYGDNVDMHGLTKPQWSTSRFVDPFDSHSRRHSFADVKSHQSSKPLGQLAHTNEEDEEDVGSAWQLKFPQTQHSSESDLLVQLQDTIIAKQAKDEVLGRVFADDYFDGTVNSQRHYQELQEETLADIQADEDKTASDESGLNPYAVPEVISRPARRFYMVAFKCSRADVYFLPEGQGLELKVGDMAITEGDRGNDLGTVTHVDVTLTEAKELKELAAIDHFRWLMLFSRHSMNANLAKVSPDGMLATTHGTLDNALVSITNDCKTLPEQYAAALDTEVKPRAIRRVAQAFETNGLRDKEGAEAKAKRICQAKVAEHGLKMEILDAEYQMDYKKLTFFYYADHYINFNELVTELFKIYKTRIWMSAINPASFASAAGILHIPPPSTIGPGAVGSRNSRPRAPIGTVPTLPEFSASGPPMAGLLPVSLGHTRDAFRLNDDAGAVRGPVTMQEEARRTREIGMPQGMAPFQAPPVVYRFADVNAAQMQNRTEYHPFESQIPSWQGNAAQGNTYSQGPGQWPPAPQSMQAPPLPFSRFNQYTVPSASQSAPNNAYPATATGMGTLPSDNFVAVSRPSPTAGISTQGGLSAISGPSPVHGPATYTAGFPTISGPSPVHGLGTAPQGGFASGSQISPAPFMTPSTSAGSYYSYSPMRPPTSTAATSSSYMNVMSPLSSNTSISTNNAYYNPYAPTSQSPFLSGNNGAQFMAAMGSSNALSNTYAAYSQASLAPGGRSSASRPYLPDDDWVARMGNSNVARLQNSTRGSK